MHFTELKPAAFASTAAEGLAVKAAMPTQTSFECSTKVAAVEIVPRLFFMTTISR